MKNMFIDLSKTPDMTPEEEAELIANNVNLEDCEKDKISLSEEKVSAIASGIASNSTEIIQYIQDNNEYYQEYAKNPDRKLEVPMNPTHVTDL